MPLTLAGTYSTALAVSACRLWARWAIPELQPWYAFFGPAGFPAVVAEAWERELAATLESREVVEQLTQLGLDVETSTGEQCAKRLAADMLRWQSILDTLGIKATY